MPTSTDALRWSLPLLLLLAAPAPGTSAAGGSRLSAPERRAMAAIDAAVPDALALLQQLVDQNSGTHHHAGVRAVGDMLAPRLEALGLRTRWVDGEPFGRAGHLLARRSGRHPRLRVLLIGHLDTVFEADSPFQKFVRLDDSTAAGPGVADMKGGDVVMLLAIRGLAAAGALDRFDLRVVLSGDEENAGRPFALSRRDLIEAGRDCDIAIGFEDGAGRPGEAVTARRGSSGWTLRVSGRRAHSSQIFRPGVGAGAVYEAARILNEFRDSLAAEPHLTLNAGLVLGGSEIAMDPVAGKGSASGKSNVVPETTVVNGDLRALTPEQFARARDVMKRIVGRHLPGTDASITFSEGYPPLAPGAGHDALLATFDGASRDMGLLAVRSTNPDDCGAADVSFVGEIVPMVLDGVGLCGSGGHSLEEQADLRMLALNAQRVAIMLLRRAGVR